MVKAINVIVAKLEGQTIYRHPDYNMDDRLLFHKIDWEKGVITLDGKTYELKTKDFPTVNPQDPYTLSPEEHQLMNDIQAELPKANACSATSASSTATARYTAA